MAKLTKKRVLDVIAQTCDVQNWDAWNDANGNKERTKINHLLAICSIKDCINTVSVFETHYPDGIAEVVEEYRNKYEQFRQQFIKVYPDDFISYSLTLDLSPIGATKYDSKKDPAEEVKKFCGEHIKAEETNAVESEYSGKTLRELRKLCRERNITVPSGATAEDLVALLEEFDESGEKVEDSTSESNVEEVEESEESSDDETVESEEETDEDESSDEESDNSLSYDEMEISELRAECKKRGIEFSKNTKAHVLIDLLTEDDKKSDEADDLDDSEDPDTEVDELDEILDEEFVDEEIEAAAKEEEESKSVKGKHNKR